MPAAPPTSNPNDSEYQNLLSVAKSLPPSTIPTELHDCCRYGETDSVRAILEIHGDATFPPSSAGGDNSSSSSSPSSPLVDIVDAHGATPLHKACANGHAAVAALLLDRNARFLTNEGGNTPLHWAARNGHEECVALLLERVITGMDVLSKNDAGRSALTEGFASENTKVVGMLLEHDSASEEKLLGGGGDEADGKGVVHEFLFRGGVEEEKGEEIGTVFVRELPIKNADNPFGDKPEDDTTGLGIWCASLIMAQWVSSPSLSKVLHDKDVLELGAGCGVPGLAAAVYSRAKSICLTDINPATVKNLQHNIDLNQKSLSSSSSHIKMTARTINWDDKSSYPPDQKYDYILGSDLIYQSSLAPLLKKILSCLLKKKGTFLYVAPVTGRDGLEDFIDLLTSSRKHGGIFQLTRKSTAPEEYRCNPLKSGDEADCFLHFGELRSVEYVLYEFLLLE